MMTRRFISRAVPTALCIGMIGLAGCDKSPAPPLDNSAPAPSASAQAQAQPPAYVPPSADQLYQLVAPIALFPDKLVAQVLAGATYPDQIGAAEQLLTNNPKLSGGLLQAAVDPQPWDASVKGLTVFPSVLDQMARNPDWTRQLGSAYVNDPTDVLNAIQVMRERAAKQGSLRDSPQQRVTSRSVTETTTTELAAPADDAYPTVYEGPAVVPAPSQTYVIEPAQDDVVYVPSYDPGEVYGQTVVYPGYRYERPDYSSGDVVAIGAVSFGAGILLGSLLGHDHHDHYDRGPSWGWNNWGMHWGGGPRQGPGGWSRPAVVHDNQVYVSRSNTVINHYTVNNINNNHIDNRRYDIDSHNQDNSRRFTQAPAGAPSRPAFDGHAAADFGHPQPGQQGGRMAESRPAQMNRPMSMPHFDAAATQPGRDFAHAQAARPAPVGGDAHFDPQGNRAQPAGERAFAGEPSREAHGATLPNVPHIEPRGGEAFGQRGQAAGNASHDLAQHAQNQPRIEQARPQERAMQEPPREPSFRPVEARPAEQRMPQARPREQPRQQEAPREQPHHENARPPAEHHEAPRHEARDDKH